MQIALAPGGGPTGTRVGVRGGEPRVRGAVGLGVVTFGVTTDREAVGVVGVSAFSSPEQATATAKNNTALNSAMVFI